MRYLFWILFWFLYFPLLRILTLFLFWNSKVEERERFEKRNKFEALAHSFSDHNAKADICFQFSSEGEFQQVAPLIEDALAQGKKIELVFFSPSVEKGVMKLAAQHPRQIRYLRYPLVRLFPFIQRRSFSHWITAKTLVMVRYDLFPEFLLWAMKSSNELKIIWMTFKKERSKGHGPSFWKKLFLKNASTIVFAGVPDKEQAKTLGLKGETFDFRVEQINRRILKKEEKFKTHFPLYPEYKKSLAPKRVILGNAWPSDLFLLRDLPADVQLVIVPHQLSNEILNLFREGLDGLGREVFELNDSTNAWKNSPTVLVNKKGILCELYADFTHSYVGGGFEGSIHSVLEPLVAGSDKLACGPFHHRSTEYDVALDLGKISEVNTPEQFMSWLNAAAISGERAKIDSLLNGYRSVRELVLSC